MTDPGSSPGSERVVVSSVLQAPDDRAIIAPARTHVTDHAVLRYLERVLGLDVERHRREIARLARVGVEHGASGVVTGKVVLKLKGAVVVTVAPAHRPDPRTGRQRKERGGGGEG